MNDLLIILLLIFFGQTLGSLIGLAKKPSKIILHGAMSFAASMMIAISFIQLIPEGLEIAPLYIIVISFFAGIGIMMIVDRTLPHINPELSVLRSIICQKVWRLESVLH
jgi:ZIP family zinc transporter